MTAPDNAAPLAQRLKFIGFWVALLWVIEIVDTVLPWNLDAYGILPRTVSGLWGIAAAPFLHAGFAHLASNSVPLLVLGSLLMLGGARRFALVTLIIAVLGGIGTWIFGATGHHVGASGVIFGYVGYLVAVGFYERSVKSIAIGLVVGFSYGGVLWGVLPGQRGISWEGHLFGLLAGIFAARLLGRSSPSTDMTPAG